MQSYFDPMPGRASAVDTGLKIEPTLFHKAVSSLIIHQVKIEWSQLAGEEADERASDDENRTVSPSVRSVNARSTTPNSSKIA